MMEPLAPEAAPIVRRMQALWESFRTPVIEVFPKAPGLPKNKKSYIDLRRGDLSRRRISFAFHRRVSRHTRIDRARAGQQLESGRERGRSQKSRCAGRARLLAGVSENEGSDRERSLAARMRASWSALPGGTWYRGLLLAEACRSRIDRRGQRSPDIGASPSSCEVPVTCRLALTC